jgi:hypothetical protein
VQPSPPAIKPQRGALFRFLISAAQDARTFGTVWMPKFLAKRYSSVFVVIWQILSNHGLIRLKRFVSSISSKLCNYVYFYLYLMIHAYVQRFDVTENLEKFDILGATEALRCSGTLGARTKGRPCCFVGPGKEAQPGPACHVPTPPTVCP